MDVVLFSPDIPQNAGNIGRTCVATGAKLTLVRPLGFTIQDKHFKRAGLDYFEHLDWEIVDSLDPILTREEFFFFSSHATTSYTKVNYSKNTTLIFGSETAGLPQHLIDQYPDRFLTIPMHPNARCLNLSNSVAIVLYEILRQNSHLLKEL